MKKYVTRLNAFIARLRAFVPSRLPTTPAAHKAWAEAICAFAGYPCNSSFEQALAIMILHLGPTVAYKSQEYFIRSLHKAAANQVASGVIEQIREEHKKGALEPQVTEVPNA